MNKSFSFLCPPEKLTEAIRLLQTIDGVIVISQQESAERSYPDKEGRLVTHTGILVKGTCSIHAMPQMVQTLSEKAIAGFDRTTMVEFKNE